MQQMQEVRAYRIVVSFYFDALAVVAVVIPVEQDGAQRSHQAIRDIARTRCIVVVFFRDHAAKGRDASAHHIHRMRCRRQPFQRGFYIGRQAAQFLEFDLVRFQFGDGRQLAMHQQMRDFLEFTAVSNSEDIVTTVVQIIAGFTDGAKCRIAGGHA
ncbi:hypothetical protein D3C81_1139350 [compost metagenome]